MCDINVFDDTSMYDMYHHVCLANSVILNGIKNTCTSSWYTTICPLPRCFPFHLPTRRGGRPTAGQPMARPGGRATGGPSSSSRPAGGRAAAGRGGGSSSGAAPGRSAAGAQPGAARGTGAGRGGPQAVRRQLLRRALQQRRQAQKMRRGVDTIRGLIPLMRT